MSACEASTDTADGCSLASERLAVSTEKDEFCCPESVEEITPLNPEPHDSSIGQGTAASVIERMSSCDFEDNAASLDAEKVASMVVTRSCPDFEGDEASALEKDAVSVQAGGIPSKFESRPLGYPAAD